MPKPESPKFRVIVSGQVLPEKDRGAALRALAALFHSTPARMERLLRGQPVKLAKPYSRAQAEKICGALNAAGAACRMEEIAAAAGDGGDAGGPGGPGDGERAESGAPAGSRRAAVKKRAKTRVGAAERAKTRKKSRSKTRAGADNTAAADEDETVDNAETVAETADETTAETVADATHETRAGADKTAAADEYETTVDAETVAEITGETVAPDDADFALKRHAALLHFVGVNVRYYQRQFVRFGGIERPKFALTWHWPAFFAFFLWAAYRKLWQWAAAHLAGGLFLVMTFDPGPVYLLWALAWPLVANYLYYRHACRRLFAPGGVLDPARGEDFEVDIGDEFSDDFDADAGDGRDTGDAGDTGDPRGAPEFATVQEYFGAAAAAGGVSRAAVAVGMMLVFLSSMAFNHLITERVLQRAGTTDIGGGGSRGSELLPPEAGALQRGDGASVGDTAALSPRAIRSVATLNVIAAAMKTAASAQALDDPELALSLVRRIVEQRRFADGWGSAIAVRRDASGQVALVSAGPDRAFDTADDILRYIDFSAL
ncbi:MAG: hypothetical protein OXU98_02505 [Gammaproteobacteria bacterium]|nr:hypothetical protein [Gammaproteobacteria bacterium]